MIKTIRQNLGLLAIIIISVILSASLKFSFSSNGHELNLYERSSGIFESLLGLIIASYAIYVSFVDKLKEKVGDKDVLSLLNVYFLLNIILLFGVNIFYVYYPVIDSPDTFLTRLLYIFTLGVTLLIIFYLFLSAKHFIKD